ncbi:hypothetical protein OG217_05245 [Streptomyces sp. NBC_01023]|uniref:hypothetical protein n=1 Tax=Streptomyces sp. NBC_01023 TaxID=2903724 RepID=UPI003865ACDB|nr:hypothetical protein OG217_05245 [Streptomyces sp. NBC_01023]
MSTASFDARQFLQAPGPRQVLRLVVADPAGAVGGLLLRELGPELAVVPAGTGDPSTAGADEAPGLPWALLAVTGGTRDGAAVLAAAVHAARTGPPPAHLLLCPGPFTDGVTGGADAAPLPCPVTVLLAEDLPPVGTGDAGGAVASWLRLSPDAFTVRLLGPDAWSPGGSTAVTARVIKEELRVWPA